MKIDYGTLGSLALFEIKSLTPSPMLTATTVWMASSVTAVPN